MLIRTRLFEVELGHHVYVMIGRAEAFITLARKSAWFVQRQHGCPAFSEIEGAAGRLRFGLSRRVAA